MLELFILETCPYCHKVMDFMKENNIKFERRDVTNQKNYDILMKIGGQDQVPFLVDEEKKVSMYDSDLILEYLVKTYID